jgi:hypothetical protein
MLTTEGTTFFARLRKLGKPFCAKAPGAGAQPARTARTRRAKRGRKTGAASHGPGASGCDAGFVAQFISLLLI